VERIFVMDTVWFIQSVIQLLNLILLIGLVGVFVFGIRILLKFNKALDIWLSKNKEEPKDL